MARSIMNVNVRNLNEARRELMLARDKFSDLKDDSKTVELAIKAFPKYMEAFGDRSKEAQQKVAGIVGELDNIKTLQNDIRNEIRNTSNDISELIDPSVLSSLDFTSIYTGSTSNFSQLEKFRKELVDEIYNARKSEFTGKEKEFDRYTNMLKSGSIGAEEYKRRISGLKGIDPRKINDELPGISEQLKLISDFEGKINELVGENVRLQQARTKEVKSLTELLASGNESIVKGFGEITKGFGTLVKFGKDFLGVWGKIDQAASKFSKTIGVGAHGMAAIRKESIDLVAKGSFAEKYNVTAEDLMTMSSTYKAKTGRNVALDAKDSEAMAAMSAVLGDKAMVAELGAGLQNYGISMENSAKIAGRMFKEAGKYGVSFEKYSKNFLSNIKIAQSFTFRNGVRDLETMARKAAEIKLDMQNIVRFTEKLAEGGIPTAVETGANLQVLGGPFAQFSDPLQMLNEGLNDPKALLDRFVGMTKNLGYFDERRGEFATTTFDKQRLRAATKAMGMDYNQVMESVNAQAKNEFVKRKISQSETLRGLSEEDKSFLANTATVKNGQAEFSYFDEKTKQVVTASTATMSAEFFKKYKLLNQSESDDVKDIATMLRGWDDSVMGFRKQLENTKAQAVEASGLGVKAKSMIQMMGESNEILNHILMYMAMITAATVFNSIRNASNLFATGREARGIAMGGKAAKGGGGTPTVMATGRATFGGSVGAGGDKIYRTSKNAVYTQKPGETIWRDASGNPIKNQKQIDNLYNKSVSKAGTATGSVPGGVGGTATGNVPTGGTTLTKTGQKLGLGSNNAGTFGSFTAADGKQHLITKNGEHLVRENGGKWMTSTGEAVAPSRQGGLTRAFKSGSNKLNPDIISAAEKNRLAKRPTALSKAVPKLKAGFTSTPKVAGIGMGAGILGSAGNMWLAQQRYKGNLKAGSGWDKAGASVATALEYAGIGSMFGVPGMLIGAGIGAGVGYYNAEKRKRERDIAMMLGGEGMGVAEGRYSNRELKKIKKAIEKNNVDLIPEKLRKKMEASGDSHIFEGIRELSGESITANGMNVKTSNVGEIYVNRIISRGSEGGNEISIGHAATGGMVTGGTRGQDSVPFLLMPGEVVIPEKDATAIREVKEKVATIDKSSTSINSSPFTTSTRFGDMNTTNRPVNNIFISNMLPSGGKIENGKFLASVHNDNRMSIRDIRNAESNQTRISPITSLTNNSVANNTVGGGNSSESSYLLSPVTSTNIANIRSSSRFSPSNNLFTRSSGLNIGPTDLNTTYIHPNSSVSNRYGNSVRNSSLLNTSLTSVGNSFTNFIPSVKEKYVGEVKPYRGNDSEKRFVSAQSFVSGPHDHPTEILKETEIKPGMSDVNKITPRVSEKALGEQSIKVMPGGKFEFTFNVKGDSRNDERVGDEMIKLIQSDLRFRDAFINAMVRNIEISNTGSLQMGNNIRFS